MKILQINNYHYVRGGSDRVYFETSKLLQEKGHTVIHFSVNDKESLESPYKRYFIREVDYVKVNSFRKMKHSFRFVFSKEAQKNLEELIQIENPEVVHLHIFYGRVTLSILPILKKYNIPTVMTVHEYKRLCSVSLFLNSKNEICEKCAGGSYFYCIINKCYKGKLFYSSVSAIECYIRDYLFPYEKYIDKFIMVSKFILEKHLEYKPYLSKKYAQIYNFVNIENVSPYHSPGNYYLYFGRLSREKGVLTLLKAWKHFPHVKLKIVGGGDLQGEIIEYITMNTMKNVDFVEFLRDNKLFDIVKNCKFVIIPSEWYETFGLNIIEAFSCGKPVIASKIGAIPELIQDKVNGFLFESKNIESFVTAINSAESISEIGYREMSINARRFAETSFNKEIYYNELMKIYNAVINDK